MANLKEIRKRISSVKSTQKITRAMKMVSGARLTKAQQRLLDIRRYADLVFEALVDASEDAAGDGRSAGQGPAVESFSEPKHPLLVRREEKAVLAVVITSDRGLCGAFNSRINSVAEREWRAREAAGQRVLIATVGRKARDYFRRRNAPIFHSFPDVWDTVDIETARRIARTILPPFLSGEVDAIYGIYNEFQNVMSQNVVAGSLFPLQAGAQEAARESRADTTPKGMIFEPSEELVLERLVPMYVEITILRAMYESRAAELAARMTAMDSATKNADDIISRLTLKYNRLRQAAITTELMEIISGAEALNG